MKKIGSHVSISKGILKLPEILKDLDADTCQIFTKGPMRFSKSKIPDEDIEKFLKLNVSCVVHGSYLTNLVNIKEKTLENFYDDIEMTEKLGIKYYVFHPGSDVNKIGEAKALIEISKNIDEALNKFKKVCLVVEIMAGQGKVLPYKLEQLKKIYQNVEQKDRLGFCLDTCHMFAAGYDFRTKEAFEALMKEIENTIGFEKIKVIHLNDSKNSIFSKKDRHEHLGIGKIGMNAFECIMMDERFDDKIFILETPDEKKYKEEIRTLREFCKKE